MKIIQVAHGFPPLNIAGTEVYSYNLSQELAKRHKVFVFHRIDDLRKEEYTLLHNKLDNLEIFTINNTFRLYDSFRNTYKDNAIAEKFGLVLDQIKPDIVHIQHLLYLSTKIIEETKKRKIPMLFTLHDYWLICPQGQLFKNNSNICDGGINSECLECVLYQLSIKKYIFGSYYFLSKFTPGFLFQLAKNIYLRCSKFSFLNRNKAINLIEERVKHMKEICSKVDLFIAPSRFLKNKFIEFGIPEEKIAYLPYGFNLDNFRNFEKSPSNKLRFGFIGNLLPAKGLHILIKCFNKIQNNNIELKIYGQAHSYKSILGNYLNYIKKIAKNKNIQFMGGFNNRNVAKIFSEIDVLVVPSVWYENSPLVIQEAFATKTIVIASRIGGMQEIVDDSINALLFNPGDTDSLYKKLKYVIDNPDVINKFTKNMPKVKSIENNAKEIESIYGKLITRVN